jgi:hypothetical protein
VYGVNTYVSWFSFGCIAVARAGSYCTKGQFENGGVVLKDLAGSRANENHG